MGPKVTDAPPDTTRKSTSDPTPETKPAPKPVPKEFLWGSAVAGEQVEKGLHNTDWWQWANSRGFLWRSHISGHANPDNGPAFAFVNADGTPGGKFPEYLKAAKAMGQTAFRFSLEWSRIQPTQGGPYDPNALRLYHAILDACAENGLTPIVTLQHFDLPIWAHDVNHPKRGMGGWAPKGVEPGKAPLVAAFAKFSGDMAKEFGGQVKYWATLNEPMVLDISTYLVPVFPNHNHALDTESARAALINMAYAHAAAYDAIHQAEPDAMVGIAQHYRRYEPEDPDSPADIEAARQMSRFANGVLIDAVTSGNLDANADGKLDGPGEGRALGNLKNRLDWVGVNYYSRDKVAAVPFPLGKGSLKFKGIPLTEVPVIGGFFKNLPQTDSGWEIYPQGMYESLREAGAYTDAQGRNLAVIVTENGIDDRGVPDEKRPGFELEHIEQVQRAIADGVDVKGYISWSLMDNFEWNRGFSPRFGLLRVDYSDPQRSFTTTRGAQAYTEVIKEGGVTPELAKKWEK